MQLEGYKIEGCAKEAVTGQIEQYNERTKRIRAVSFLKIFYALKILIKIFLALLLLKYMKLQ